MNLFNLQLQFTSNWLASSGQNSGYVDTASERDENGLPYLPTSAIKGMWREAAYSYCRLNKGDNSLVELVNKIFGLEGHKYGSNINQGALEFVYERAQLSTKNRDLINKSQQLKEHLYLKHDKTARDKVLGNAKTSTKRSIEAVIPVPLNALFKLNLEGNELIKAIKLLKVSFLFFNKIGASKYSGLGKVYCRVDELISEHKDALLKQFERKALTIDYTKGRLSYQISPKNRFVITQNSKTTGANEICDYIPGSIMLGILAKAFYSDLHRLKVFSNNSIRFLNAYPQNAATEDGSYPMPFSFHKRKAKEDNRIINKSLDVADITTQLKQCRTGYVAQPSGDNNLPQLNIQIPKKSSRRQTATENRVSKDAALFEVTTVEPSFNYQGEISWDPKNSELNQLIEKCVNYLSSKLHKVGKKINEGYGSVSIGFSNTQFYAEPEATEEETIKVLALSDIALLNDFGQPNLCPSKLSDLGLDKLTAQATLDTSKSFIRTRRYMPFNGKRGLEPQRQLIEKGSVLVYKLASKIQVSSYKTNVGLFQCEGLGHIWINPPLLKQQEFETYTLIKQTKEVDTRLFHNGLIDETEFSDWLTAKTTPQNIDKYIDELLNIIQNLYQKHRDYNGFIEQELHGPSFSQWQNALKNPYEINYTDPIKRMTVGFETDDNIWKQTWNAHNSYIKKIESEVHEMFTGRLLKKLSRGLVKNWQQGVFDHV